MPTYDSLKPICFEGAVGWEGQRGPASFVAKSGLLLALICLRGVSGGGICGVHAASDVL